MSLLSRAFRRLLGLDLPRVRPRFCPLCGMVVGCELNCFACARCLRAQYPGAAQARELRGATAAAEMPLPRAPGPGLGSDEL